MTRKWLPRRSIDRFLMAFRKFTRDQGLFLASGLAFDLLFYCIPLALMIVSITGYILAGSQAALSATEQVVRQLFPGSHQFILDNVSVVVASRGLLGLSGILLLFFWGSATIGSIRTVLNTVFEVKTPRSFLRGKLTDLVILTVISVMLTLSVSATALLPLVHNLAGQFAWLETGFEAGGRLTGRLIGFSLTILLFYILYRFGPARTIGRFGLWTAAFTGGMLFELLKWAFAWYVRSAAAISPLYSTLGGLLFFFLWFYFVSLVFVLAATIGWTVDRGRGHASGD